MIRLRPCMALILLATSLPAPAQGLPGGVGGIPGVGSQGGGRKASEDLLSPSRNEPGVAPPLDIRIEGEGLSLPKGVSEDDQPQKPAAAPASSAAQRPAGAGSPPKPK